MRSFQSILSALLNHLRPETQSVQAEIEFASLKHLQSCIGPVSDLKHVYIRNGQTSVLYNNNLCEAFTIKRFSEIKTFHRYHRALKQKCLMTTYASLLLPVLIFCGSTSESIWLN